MSTLPLIEPAVQLKQLQNLLQKGYTSQLLFCEQIPPSIKIPALISCRMYDDAIVQLLKQQSYSPLNLLWIVACSHIVDTNYQEYYQQISKQKQQKYKQLADDWIKLNKPLHHPPEVKSLLRKKFQQILLLAQQQNYFSTPKMPVFLVSCTWLQKFYNNNISYIPAVDNSNLYQAMPWIQSDPKYMHYNYKLKQDCRQNKDYKIVSFEAWQFLIKNFGGMEFRRFTTNQKQAICELTLQTVKIVVVQNRFICGFQVFQLLASRFDTIALIIQRLKRILIAYGLIQFQSLNSTWQPILISHLPAQQLINIIHDQQKDLIKLSSQNTFQMARLQYEHDIEDSQYTHTSDIIMFNLEKNKKSFLDTVSIPYKKITKKYNKCLTCNTTQKLQQCICKQVFFCCKECRAKNKQHLKICQSLRKQQSIVNRLVDFYNVSRRKLNFENIRNGGKVGLQNLGNTCYMNAAMQCVLGVDILNQFFVSNQHVSQLNVTNVLGSEGHLACAYGQFVKDYYTTNRKDLEPIKILKIISSKNAQFRGHNHQDSQQYFNYFLDKIHEDLNRIRDKPYVQNIQSDGRPDQIVSQLSWRNYQKRNNSFISDNFAGQYRSQIRCPDCDRISITFDPFLSVTLPFPKNQPTIQVEGYLLSTQGELYKIDKKVNQNLNSQEFLNSFFKQPVHPLWLRNKVPYSQWNLKKPIKKNIQSKGILFFYNKPNNSEVEVQFKYEGFETFHRKFYIDKLQSQQDLLRHMYRSLKVPILRATKNEQTRKTPTQQYMRLCQQHKFLQITQNSIQQYPFIRGAVTIKLKIIDQKIPKLWPLIDKIKFDVAGANTYQSKPDYKPPRSLDQSLTIPSILQSFSEPEQLTQQNSWYCNKCRQHKLAQKIMSVYKLPKHLVIHLKRFNHRGNRYIIYGEKVKTPINLAEVQNINGQKYRLFGVVNHYGSLSMGHYTAYVKRSQEWYYADDSSFKRRQPEGSSAYLLFYKRIDQTK